MFEHDPVIREYEHDKFWPREAEALQTLRKVASLVKPIMRQRGWKVGILTEFWPPEKNLLGLNWNNGQKICLRLRYPSDERQFLPMEEVVDTMLHELCHIVHGPHDEAFHTLWNQLRSEHEQLTRKGYTGEGFLSTGHKLGGGRRIPMQEAHRLARAAAEKRRTLAAGSGQKLGGASLARGQDIRRVIADAAARRATVTRGCASGTERSKRIVEETSKNGFRTKADEEDADEEAIMLAYIDLIEEEEREKYGDKYIRTSKDNPAGSQGGAGTNLISPTLKNPSSPPPMPDSSKPAAIDLTTTSSSPSPPPSSSRSKITTTTTAARGSGSGSGSWTCDICTLINPATYLCCDACGTERPTSSSSSSSSPSLPSALLNNHNAKSTTTTTRQPKKSSIQSLATLSRAPPKPLGWLCHHCGTWMESEWWTCVSCGGMKQSS